MYYVVPNYATAHPPHGPHPMHPTAHPPHGPHPFHPVAHIPHGSHPSHPCAIANSQLSGVQEHSAETVEPTYYQQVRGSHYPVLPSVPDRTPAVNAQPLAHNSSLFPLYEPGQTGAAASEKGVAWNPSLQSASISSMKFRNPTVVQKGQLHETAPCKHQLPDSDRSKLPDKHLSIQQVCHCPCWGFFLFLIIVSLHS